MKFSSLMLGTVQFGLKYGINNKSGKPNLQEIEKILRLAADKGVNVIDTARSYGDSEDLIAKVLNKCGLQKQFKIITKIASFPENLPVSEYENWIKNSFIASLQALQCDRVTGVLLHNEAALPWLYVLQDLQTQGLMDFYGASLDSAKTADIDVLPAAQVPGNILDRRFDNYAERAKAAGAFVFMRSVYLQGLLLKEEKELADIFKKTLLPIRKKLVNLAKEAGISAAELYFRYALSNKNYTSILSGVETAQQLQENIKIAEAGPLSDDLLSQIEKIVPKMPEEIIRPSLWKTANAAAPSDEL